MGVTIDGSRGAGPRHPPPTIRDPILSFLHTFSPKSTHVRGWCPPPNGSATPTGNPGFATGQVPYIPYTKPLFINLNKYLDLLFSQIFQKLHIICQTL